jgi:hypothetical protein
VTGYGVPTGAEWLAGLDCTHATQPWFGDSKADLNSIVPKWRSAYELIVAENSSEVDVQDWWNQPDER